MNTNSKEELDTGAPIVLFMRDRNLGETYQLAFVRLNGGQKDTATGEYMIVSRNVMRNGTAVEVPMASVMSLADATRILEAKQDVTPAPGTLGTAQNILELLKQIDPFAQEISMTAISVGFVAYTYATSPYLLDVIDTALMLQHDLRKRLDTPREDMYIKGTLEGSELPPPAEDSDIMMKLMMLSVYTALAKGGPLYEHLD